MPCTLHCIVWGCMLLQLLIMAFVYIFLFTYQIEKKKKCQCEHKTTFLRNYTLVRTRD